jgi:hypothetical protein
MSDQQSKTETAAAIRSNVGLDALEQFLENHGEDLLSWRDGSIVIQTYYDKKFRALGGDTNPLISFFEDYCNMPEASRKYIEALKASNADSSQPAPKI